MNKKDDIMSAAAEFVQEKKAELNAWRVPEDLEALYKDITLALSEKGADPYELMPHYQELMQKEQDMYDPFVAYEMGREHCRKEYQQAFMCYMRCIDGNPENQAILRERDKLFYRMCDILGDDERRLLLTDYNEIFRQYHGIISQHIGRFFDMGFHETGSNS